MRNCGAIIEKAIKQQRVMRKDISAFVGISPTNLNKLLAKESIDAYQLERFCQFLNLDPCEFFDYRPGYTAPSQVGSLEQHTVIGTNQVAVNNPTDTIIERLLSEKDKRIEALEQIIEIQKAHIKTLESLRSTDA